MISNQEGNNDHPNVEPKATDPNELAPNVNPLPDGQGEQQIVADPNINPGGIQQVDDPYLFETMKRVKEMQENKKYYDPNPRPIEEQKEEEKKEEDEKKEDENEPLDQKNKVSDVPIANVQKEFKNLFNKNMLQNNSYRRRLLHMLIIIIIVNCILWEVLCLFMNVCYGEKYVMQKWVSHSICPMIFILLICYVLLFFSSDYLYKPGIQIANILIIVLLLLFIGFGIYSIIRALGISTDALNDRWNSMSFNSQNYFTDFDDFKKEFKTDMLVTAIFYFFIAVTGIVLIIFSYQFFYLLTETAFDWRPPLRSRLHDDRAQRILNLYALYNEDFRRLYEAEHKKKEENKEPELPHLNNEIKAEGIEMQNLNKEPPQDNNVIKEDAPLQENKKTEEINNNLPSHQLGEDNNNNIITNTNPSQNPNQPKRRRLPPLKKKI